ncbi:four helix bundle protein [candidate division WOR-3 bacterium]|uniref:Four helix bundle protein n=1 Tax=candidate division WOR-3 bacterium TaxID=2052148 RepID=A0A9D5K9D8_UNCW3|nr:four helix bundle protein [candidate division WOR-3 bacterium]MBD3364030.1 four helix bundle protein [candidate division WOR-3 bacterium]
MRNIRKYDVFKKSHELALDVYRMTNKLPKQETFGLISQMRRAAYSIPMNLSEGAARETQKEFAQFVNVSLGSCEEVRYQLLLSKDLNYISQESYIQLDKRYEDVKRMLTRLYRRLRDA